MLRVYNASHAVIYSLQDCYQDYHIEYSLDGNEILYFSMPLSDARTAGILPECYIRTSSNEYLVKERNIQGDWCEIVCKLNTDDLRATGRNAYLGNSVTIQTALNEIIGGTGWTTSGDIAGRSRTLNGARVTAWDLVDAARDLWRAEYRIDTISKVLYIYSARGSDNGVVVLEGLNLKELEVQANSHELITRLYPYGKDGLDISSVNSGLAYIDDHTYSAKHVVGFWQDTRYIDAASLLADATVKLAALATPRVAYSVSMADLSATNPGLAINLGDTVRLASYSQGVSGSLRIVKMDVYPEEPDRNQIELSNVSLMLDSLITRATDAADTIGGVISDTGNVLGSTIANGSVGTSQIADNSITNAKVASLIADKITSGLLQSVDGKTYFNLGTAEIAQSTTIAGHTYSVKLNPTDGFGIYKGTDKVFGIDGSTGNLFTVGDISADDITAGTLSSGDGSLAIDLDTSTLTFGSHIANLSTGRLVWTSSQNTNATDYEFKRNYGNVNLLVSGTLQASEAIAYGSKLRAEVRTDSGNAGIDFVF